MVNAPARDPGDLGIANSAETALLHPEKAKSFGAPERVQHVKTFPLFKIGFIRRVVRVGFAFDFNVSFNGCATGVVQPRFGRKSTSFDEQSLQQLSVRSSTIRTCMTRVAGSNSWPRLVTFPKNVRPGAPGNVTVAAWPRRNSARFSCRTEASIHT